MVTGSGNHLCIAAKPQQRDDNNRDFFFAGLKRNSTYWLGRRMAANTNHVVKAMQL